MRTHYDNLKIKRNASMEEVKAAYRSLAQKWHPDKHENKKLAERNFKIINQAYYVLSDKQRRKEYDASILLDEMEQPAASPATKAESSMKGWSYKPENKGEKEAEKTYQDYKRKIMDTAQSLLIIPFIVMAFIAYKYGYKSEQWSYWVTVFVSFGGAMFCAHGIAAYVLHKRFKLILPKVNYRNDKTLKDDLKEPLFSSKRELTQREVLWAGLFFGLGAITAQLMLNSLVAFLLAFALPVAIVITLSLLAAKKLNNLPVVSI